jgi:VCBS repeat protein
VSNMYANSRWALFHPEWPVPIPWYMRWAPRARVDRVIDELSRGNTLKHNNGDGTFTDVSDAAGIRDAQWGWGAEFVDYNDDGRLDVYNSNGFITGPILDDV